MRRFLLVTVVVLSALALVWAKGEKSGKTPWSIKASYIESCSCRMFCPCYFSTQPDKQMCEFNNVIMIKKGNFGTTKLDGLKLWLTGDLGEDFGDGQAEWLVVTVEPTTTEEQIDALGKIFSVIYPASWNEFRVDKKKITMEFGETPHATLGNGEAEVKLEMIKDQHGKQVVINNLNYWAAQSNTGFRLGYGTHRYKGNGKDFEHEHVNGFLIDIEGKGEI
ncbi:MAG: hypothetical protein A2145_05565 [candidate division Zixibacteria bacterium RBG_16_40_9]|nr:MAG: hypothetical protein A2145_05565 [candidate division Zixibacteria bacterium RBG_16_40_9]